MEKTIVIRFSEALAILPIGIYWFFFPNDFSEPLIVIFGAVAILIGETVNISTNNDGGRNKWVESNIYQPVFILVPLIFSLFIYILHYFSIENKMRGVSPFIMIGGLIFVIIIIGFLFGKKAPNKYELYGILKKMIYLLIIISTGLFIYTSLHTSPNSIGKEHEELSDSTSVTSVPTSVETSDSTSVTSVPTSVETSDSTSVTSVPTSVETYAKCDLIRQKIKNTIALIKRKKRGMDDADMLVAELRIANLENISKSDCEIIEKPSVTTNVNECIDKYKNM